ncbi:type II toxin-antitoxin system RelE/ParE family toxin [Pontiella sulfatireligans]|uniref:Plasmid stabilization protein n=1 Tax=Pontiella sulfatireligans TaxID=2750658 RepID=A0A6C2URF8_9BACT|nr:type II toxin-antitoxin system RelE/ParE family toxin [Pontiella sulfatireligans]VGO22719.1 hypothetical protein SCARR_04815 [Pontiella sulfatireligans]
MELILSSAAKHYEEEVEGLGKAFVESLRTGLLHIRNHPEASVAIKQNYRRHLLSRFPFGIVYRIDDGTIFVAAVMHLRRKPDYWLTDPAE